MYCRAITKKGTPCIHTTKNKYCWSHTRKYESCPICMDDMQTSSRLTCGHIFCISCLSQCDSTCPLCRRETNVSIPLETHTCKSLLLYMMKDFETECSESIRAKRMHGIFDFFISSHVYFSHDRVLLDSVQTRLYYFKKLGFDMDEHIRRVSSICQRL